MKFFALITAIFSLLLTQNTSEIEIGGESRVLGGSSQAALVLCDASDHQHGVKTSSKLFVISPMYFEQRPVALGVTSFSFNKATGRTLLLGAVTARGPPAQA